MFLCILVMNIHIVGVCSKLLVHTSDIWQALLVKFKASFVLDLVIHFLFKIRNVSVCINHDICISDCYKLLWGSPKMWIIHLASVLTKFEASVVLDLVINWLLKVRNVLVRINHDIYLCKVGVWSKLLVRFSSHVCTCIYLAYGVSKIWSLNCAWIVNQFVTYGQKCLYAY